MAERHSLVDIGFYDEAYLVFHMVNQQRPQSIGMQALPVDARVNFSGSAAECHSLQLL